MNRGFMRRGQAGNTCVNRAYITQADDTAKVIVRIHKSAAVIRSRR